MIDMAIVTTPMPGYCPQEVTVSWGNPFPELVSMAILSSKFIDPMIFFEGMIDPDEISVPLD